MALPTMSSEPIETTLKRAKAGDRDALESLLRRHDTRLQRVARGLMGEQLKVRVRTSDILQSTYLEVLASVHDFRGDTEEAFAHWVVRILENNVRDAAKYHGARKRSRDMETSSKDLGELFIPAIQPSPSSQAIATEELFLVGRALQRLPEDYRRVILIRLSPTGTHRETARRMGRSEGAARVLLARARAALLMELDKLRKESHA